MAVGRDAVAAAALVAAAGALVLVAVPVRNLLVSTLRNAVLGAAQPGGFSIQMLEPRLVALVLAVCAAAAGGGLAAGLAQTKGGFWPQLAAPDLTRLAGGRLGKIFSRDGLLDLGVAMAKVAAIVWAVAGIWRVRFLALGRLVGAPPETLLDGAASWFVPMAVRLFLVLVFLAGVDVAVTRLRFAKRMRMTREESRRELREDEGDPLMRGRRKRRHRELSRGRVSLEVPRADAVVVNPTHVAVAIRYRREDGAPRVTCKGKGKIAEVMRELARENGVPIVENIPLARLLYKRVKVGKQVPAETYKAVAAILAFVYRVTGRRMGAGATP